MQPPAWTDIGDSQAGPSDIPIPLQKHCDRQKANLRIRFKPSLFQHVGTHSSLAGKIQKLKVGFATLGPGWGWQGKSPSRGSPL